MALLGCDEGTEEEQSQEVVDDPDEVLMPGSDEEFDSEEEDWDDLDNENNGTGLCTVFYNHCTHTVGLDYAMELDQEVITPQPSIPLATPVGVTVSTTTIPPTTSIPHPCSSRSPSPLPPPLPPLPQTTFTPTTDPHSSRSPSPLPPPLPPLPPAGVAQPTSTQPTHKPSQATSAWTSDLTAPVIEDFIPPPTIGPTVPIPDKYLDIFKLFVTQELLENIRD